MTQRPLPPQCTVGIDPIDDEHRRLFELIDSVQQALASTAADPAACAQASIDALMDYTRTHFGHEEALMAAARYPDLAAHRELHAALLAQATDMAMRIEFGDPTGLLDLAGFLNRWLTEHIQGEDCRFGKFASGRPAG